MWHGHNGGVLAAKLKGITLGLRLAWSLELERVCLEFDSLKALAMVEHGCGLQHHNFGIFMETSNFLAKYYILAKLRYFQNSSQ